MNQITKRITLFVACVVIVFSVYETASACQADEFYNSKEGALAVSIREALNEAFRFEELGNMDKLADLMKSGSFATHGECQGSGFGEVERIKMLKIKFSDKRDPSWIKDGALNKNNCN